MDAVEKWAIIWSSWDTVAHESEMARLALMAECVIGRPKGSVMWLSRARQPMVSATTGLFEVALAKGAEWILWLDDDCLPPADAFHRLRADADPQEHPVVSGLAFFRQPPYWPSVFEYPYRPAEGHVRGIPLPVRDWPRDQLFKCDAVGLCCCLFHRSVFERIEKPWFDFTSDGSPDGYLMQRLISAGIPVHCDSRVKVGHLRPAPVGEADYWAWCEGGGGVEGAHSLAVKRWVPHDPNESKESLTEGIEPIENCRE